MPIGSIYRMKQETARLIIISSTRTGTPELCICVVSFRLIDSKESESNE